MPVAIGRWLLTSRTAQGLAARLMQHGRTVQTTSLNGFLQLYFLAGFRRWRRRSLRFQEEQCGIDQWLEKLKDFAREDYAAAVQIAEFPRVVKGYGDTHVNGRRKFDLLMSSLSGLRRRKDAATILRNLIDSALADENGAKLNETLGTIVELKSTQTEPTSTILGIEPASHVTPVRVEGHGR
jgi:indolepyruvate ferredoxin oxidoreductase beta subunit